MNSNQLYSEYFTELNELLEKYNIEDELKTKIISGINTGLPEKEFGRVDFYDYLAKILASNTSKDPVFSKIAGVYQVKIYNEEIGTDYLNLVNRQYLQGLISEKFYNFVSTNQDMLIDMIDWERDELIDYFGLKTLERSYLLKDAKKKFIERPQMMWLRVGIQIHGLWEGEIDNKSRLELIKSTYDLMSQLYFTHATPTLFNSGSNYPQLSSCYLLQCPDDLKLIGDSFKSIMMISKWAGGIGINLSDIRSNNSLIKSTGGRTNGIIPLCKTLESLARYVNQCFTKDTIVYSKNGPMKVENIKINDELITKDGTFQKVLKIFKNSVNKEILKIRTTHSFETTSVTNEHQIYAITGQPKTMNFSVIKNRLNKNIISEKYISANELKEEDFIGYPIPNFILDSNYDEDYFRMYGIILGDGHATKKKTKSIEFEITLGTETKMPIYNFVTNYLTNKQIHYCTNRQDDKKTIHIRWTQNEEKLAITYDDIYDKEHDKKIKNEYLNLPKNKTLALIKGLLETDGHCGNEIYFNTSSRPLAYSMRYLFLRLGILTSGYIRPSGETQEIQPNEFITTKKNGYVLRIPKHAELKYIYGENMQYSTKVSFFEHNNILWSRIKKIYKEYHNGEVYDFNMNNNHNYLTDMGLVHNSGKRLGSIATFLEPWHGDIEDFIQLRKNTGDDNLRARDLFLGLWVCDMFMKAVETDGDWYLMNPSDCLGLTDTWGPEFETLYTRYVLEGKYVKKIKARELYKKITECQFETGMPYMMFKDTINARSNQQNLGTIKNSNLCVAPETQILTDKGYFKIVDLKDKKVNIWNGEKFSEIIVRQTGVKQKLIKINFSNYESIECTPYHKFYIYKTKCKTEIIEASKLQPGMKLVKYNLPVINIETELKYPYTCGLFSADGTYENCVDIHNDDDEQCIAISNIPKPILSLYGEKKKLIDYIECRNDLEICKGDKYDTVRLNTDIADKYFVPINYSVETKLKWLAGLSDGNGSLSVNQDNKSIQISSIHLDFLKNIRLMLTTLGINPKITTLKEEGQILLPDDKGTNKLYDCKKCYRLLITSNHLYKLNELGFKTNRLDNKCNKPQIEAMSFISIKNVEDLGRYDDTYCFNEPEKHSGIFNGILTSNCSEITEYSSPDEIAVCNLASVSLPKFVSTKVDGTKYFDFETFGKTIQLMVLNLNNGIDMNYYPVPQTAKSNLAHRPIGVGVQGLVDCYYLMGYSFDSPEATKLNKQIFECAYWHGLKMSNDLAKTRGKYSTFDGSPYSKGQLQFHLAGYTTEQIADKELGLDWVNLIKSIVEFGTKNSLITTIMPTASTAQILNNNESVEPYASNIYVRKVLAGEYMIVNKHLVRDLKKYNLWNNQIIGELLYDNGSVQKLDIPQELKDKYKTAYELKQSVIVKQAVDRGLFIDQSQSMNLFMENPDHNKLASAHIFAWKNGLKTGSYYIRTKPITEATKFSIDIEQINLIKLKRNINDLNLPNQINSNDKKTYNDNYKTCESCSA